MGNYNLGHNLLYNSCLEQWVRIQNGEQSIFINKISGQQFNLINNAISQTQINAYNIRNLYTFPNTPKILLVQVSSLQIKIFIERGNQSLIQFLNSKKNSPFLIISLLKTILQTLNWLRKKYGGFYVKQSMIRINKNNKVLVWINQNFANSSPQYFIPEDEAQQLMISKVIKIFSPFINVKFLEKKKNFNDVIKISENQLMGDLQKIKTSQSSTETNLKQFKVVYKEPNFDKNKVYNIIKKQNSQTYIKFQRSDKNNIQERKTLNIDEKTSLQNDFPLNYKYLNIQNKQNNNQKSENIRLSDTDQSLQFGNAYNHNKSLQIPNVLMSSPTLNKIGSIMMPIKQDCLNGQRTVGSRTPKNHISSYATNHKRAYRQKQVKTKEDEKTNKQQFNQSSNQQGVRQYTGLGLSNGILREQIQKEFHKVFYS